MIYVCWAEGTSYFKIGYSEDPSKRLKELQTANPVRLHNVIVSSGSQSLENLLHQLIGGARVQGEWFDLWKVQDIIRKDRDTSNLLIKLLGSIPATAWHISHDQVASMCLAVASKMATDLPNDKYRLVASLVFIGKVIGARDTELHQSLNNFCSPKFELVIREHLIAKANVYQQR